MHVGDGDHVVVVGGVFRGYSKDILDWHGGSVGLVLLVEPSSVILQAHVLVAIFQSEEGGAVLRVVVVKVTVVHLGADRLVSFGVRHGLPAQMSTGPLVVATAAVVDAETWALAVPRRSLAAAEET